MDNSSDNHVICLSVVVLWNDIQLVSVIQKLCTKKWTFCNVWVFFKLQAVNRQM